MLEAISTILFDENDTEKLLAKAGDLLGLVKEPLNKCVVINGLFCDKETVLNLIINLLEIAKDFMKVSISKACDEESNQAMNLAKETFAAIELFERARKSSSEFNKHFENYLTLDRFTCSAVVAMLEIAGEALNEAIPIHPENDYLKKAGKFINAAEIVIETARYKLETQRDQEPEHEKGN
jgi:hypothetical protein